MKRDKIYLVGFMGVGKTSVARALASRLHWQANDIDELIEARERRTVSEIFAREGEPYFRAIEREILQLLLPLRDTVVATGGGTFADAGNRSAINLDGFSVWLDAPLEVLLPRIPGDGRRPLAADPARVRWLFDTRRAAYAQAHLRIDAAEGSVADMVERILLTLERS